MPQAAWMLLIVGSLFLALGLYGVVRKGWPPSPQARTWLKIGVLFLLVCAYLRYVHGPS